MEAVATRSTRPWRIANTPPSRSYPANSAPGRGKKALTSPELPRASGQRAVANAAEPVLRSDPHVTGRLADVPESEDASRLMSACRHRAPAAIGAAEKAPVGADPERARRVAEKGLDLVPRGGAPESSNASVEGVHPGGIRRPERVADPLRVGRQRQRGHRENGVAREPGEVAADRQEPEALGARGVDAAEPVARQTRRRADGENGEADTVEPDEPVERREPEVAVAALDEVVDRVHREALGRRPHLMGVPGRDPRLTPRCRGRADQHRQQGGRPRPSPPPSAGFLRRRRQREGWGRGHGASQGDR